MRYRSLCISTIFVLTAAAAYGGPVSGRVLDPDGRTVPGVRVLLVGGATVRTTSVTNSRGEFTLVAPDTGRFELRVALVGFRADSIGVDGTAAAQDVGTIKMAVSAVSESLVVTAAQVDIPQSRASASVTVITGDELQSRQIHTIADALRAVPGLSVATNGGRGALTSVFPRGGESDYTLVFVDGIQANAFGGGFDFAHLATANVERIEIVRGPQSALYGSNAIGSVVRVITRRGGPVLATGAVEGGGFGTARLSSAVSGSRGAWDWGGLAEWLTSDGMNGQRTRAGEEIVNDDYTRGSAAVSAGWRRDDGRSVRGHLRYARDERGAPGPFGANPGGTFAGIDAVSRGSNDRWSTSVATLVPMGRRVRSQAQLTYGRLDGVFVSPAFGDPTRTSRSESSSRRITARWQSDFVVGPSVDVSAGVESQRERAGSPFITDERSQEVPVKRRVTGYFGEGRWQASERLFVTAGVRMEEIHRDSLAADPFGTHAAFPGESIVSTNPKIGAAWFVRSDADSFTKVRGSAGTGIRPPNEFEIAFTDNPSLKPERSRSADVGLDQAFAKGRGLVEATFFLNNYDDLIVAVGRFQQSSRYQTDNISNARAQGLELAGTVRGRLPASSVDVQLRVGYTLLDTEILAVDRDDQAPPPFAVGDRLLRRPRHQLFGQFLIASGRLTGYLDGGGRSRTLDVDPSFGSFGGVFQAPGFQAWNAGVSWRVDRRFEVVARIENLFDREYEEALGFPALGRGAMVGLRFAARR